MNKVDYNNMSEQEQIEVVSRNGILIQHIKNPSLEVQLTAVSQNGSAIRFVKNPSEQVQITAISHVLLPIVYLYFSVNFTV